ncbi:MAG TPA: spore photoproduct lyase [Clostridiales bacterium]|nr:spore photoproduct lyase [Clostridiales bacterium]
MLDLKSFPDAVYYEPEALKYPLGRLLREKYGDKPWIEIESHNSIPELQKRQNREFPKLKRLLILGVRKTHKYVPNHKVSNFLVPFTSSGCSAMCLYCYLVCNYNKCSYLRIFVNREQMMERLIGESIKADTPQTFEIGSNSDLILENQITDNLTWIIENFGAQGRGTITFPTKFSMVESLLNLNHQGKVLFRMSINPEEIVRRVEIGTSPLSDRIRALNNMCDAGYRVGILLAPVIMLPGWRDMYGSLLERLASELSEKVKREAFIEIIFMTYSFVQNFINTEAFPHALQIFDRESMTGRGRGKYCYREPLREEGEAFLREKTKQSLGDMPILYVV